MTISPCYHWQDEAKMMTAYAYWQAGQSVAAGVACGRIPEQPVTV